MPPSIDRRNIVQQLRNVIDPELGVNIVDLGLLYNIIVDNTHVLVEYTATTPGCPMRRFLKQQIEEALESITGITDYEIRLVWDPVWSVDMILPGVDFFAVPPPQLSNS